MMVLIGLNIVAALLVLVGFNLAFRHKAVRTRFGQKTGGASNEPDELASVFRIAGVMIMAFGITTCAFGNLIAYYSGGGA